MVPFRPLRRVIQPPSANKTDPITQRAGEHGKKKQLMAFRGALLTTPEIEPTLRIVPNAVSPVAGKACAGLADAAVTALDRGGLPVDAKLGQAYAAHP